MKITMLGLSGSGKTSYMGALYQALGEKTVDGFSMFPEQKNGEDEMVAFGNWRNLALHANQGGFRMGTDITTLWPFDLVYQGSRLCSFEWIDYRGGIWHELGSNESSRNPAIVKEREDVLHQVLNSNAIIIFADAIKLAHYDNDAQRRKFCGADVINNVIRLCALKYPRRALTIVIAIAKSDSDAIKPEFKRNNYSRLISRAFSTYSEVASLCGVNDNWRGAFLPVSAIGIGKSKTTITFPDKKDWHKPIIVDTKVEGFPEQVNTEHALFYCLGVTLSRIAKNSHIAIQEYEEQILDAHKNSGLFRRMAAMLTGQPAPKEAIAELMRKKNEEIITLKKFEPHIMRLFEIAQQKIVKI